MQFFFLFFALMTVSVVAVDHRDLLVLESKLCASRRTTCQAQTPETLPIERWESILGFVSSNDTSLELVKEAVRQAEDVNFDGLRDGNLRSELSIKGAAQAALEIPFMIVEMQELRADLKADRVTVQDAALTVNARLGSFLENYGDAIDASGLRPAVESSQYMTQSLFRTIHDICGDNPCELIFVIPLIVPVLFFELLLFVLNLFTAFWVVFWHGGSGARADSAKTDCAVDLLECSYNRMVYAMIPALLTAVFVEAGVNVSV